MRDLPAIVHLASRILFPARKFKISACSTTNDHTALQVHDIGIVLSQIGAGETGYEETVGRGQDRV